MARAPRVTFLMGTHNRAQFLRDAVQSVLGQNYGDFEFIVVDDGSTDETPDLLVEYAREDSRIRLFTQQKAGLAAALNLGVAQARGEFLARMDDDDVCLPERTDIQLDALSKDVTCVGLGTAVIRIDEDGEELDTLYPETMPERIEEQLLRGNGAAIVHPTLLARTAVVRHAGNYNPRYSSCAQDLDLFLRLAELGKLRNISDLCLKFRVDSRNKRKFTEVAAEARRRTEEEILRNAFQRRGWQKSCEHTVSQPNDRGQWCYQIAHLALAGGNVKAARKHLYRAIACAPLRLSYYRLLLRATRLGGLISAQMWRSTSK